MTSPLRSAILGGVATLALSIAAAAAASPTLTTADSGPDRDTIRDGHGDWIGHRGGEPEHMAVRLRDILQLTPAQEPALQAFLSAMHPPRDGRAHATSGAERMREHGPPLSDPAARKADMDKRMADMKTRVAEMENKRAEQAALTTPQRLDLMLQKMAERTAKRQAEMRAHVAAVKTFYAALTPAQQKAFDALHSGMMGGPGPDHGRRMMPMGMMEPPAPPIPPLAMRAPMPQAPPPPEPPLPQY